MPVNISSVGHWSLPPEQSAPTSSQPSGPASPSPQDTQATINRGIQEATQNFAPIVGADAFTVETNGSETTLHFGDGAQGKTPPSGSNEESAYRTGGGETGNDAAADQAPWIAIRNRMTVIR